jgi:Spy/CpxP family protein refolding chaperone
MRPRLTAAACVLFTILPSTIHVEDLDSSRRWWRAADMQRRLGLSAAQVATLDDLFDRGLPERIALHRQIEEMDRFLAHSMAGDDADDHRITNLSEQLEALRARQNVRRTLMLFAMHQALTKEQRQRLAEIHRSTLDSSRHLAK